jgi:O-antigen ligase
VAPAVTVIAIPLLLVTGSRSALLVAAVGLVLALLIWSLGQRHDGRVWWLWLALPVALAASVGALVWITGFAARDVAIDRLGGYEDDLRWPVWQSIIEMLPRYMPWGTGVGSYAQAYKVLEPDSLLRPTISNHAHNEFLEVAFTAGIPGLVLMGLTAAALIISLWRTFSSNVGQDPAVTLSRLGAGIIVLLAIASATDYPTRTPILAAVFALAAVWASLGSQAADAHKSQ